VSFQLDRVGLIHGSAHDPGAGHRALRSISLAAGRGERLAIIGPSGAGKTRILDTLRHIREMIAEGSHSSGSCNWSLTVEAGGNVYKWEVEIEAGFYPGRFVRELIVRNEDENLVDRAEIFFFKGKELPRLQESRSAVELGRIPSTVVMATGGCGAAAG